MTGRAVFTGEAIEASEVEGALHLVGCADPGQVLAAAEVGAGDVGRAEGGFHFRQRERRPEPLRVPLRPSALPGDIDFVRGVFHHNLSKEGFNLPLAIGRLAGGFQALPVREIELIEGHQTRHDGKLDKDDTPAPAPAFGNVHGGNCSAGGLPQVRQP